MLCLPKMLGLQVSSTQTALDSHKLQVGGVPLPCIGYDSGAWLVLHRCRISDLKVITDTVTANSGSTNINITWLNAGRASCPAASMMR